MRRLWAGLAMAISLAAITAGGVVISQDEPPAEGTANLWIDDDGGTCTRSASPAAYNDAAACPVPTGHTGDGTQDAFVNAQNGDLVLVKDQTGGDDYGIFTLDNLSKTVTFRAEVEGIEFSEAHFACTGCTVDGFKFENRSPRLTANDAWVCQKPGMGTNVTPGLVGVCGIDVTITNFEIDGLQSKGTSGDCPPNGLDSFNDTTNNNGMTLRDGSIHGTYNSKGMEFDGNDVTIDGVHFYDFWRGTECDPDVHNECVYTPGPYSDFVFSDNILEGCPSGQGLAMLGSCSGAPSNILIENNAFFRTNEGSGADRRDDWHPSGGIRGLFIGGSACEINSTWTVRYNTFETTPDADAADTLGDGAGDGQWYGNLGGADCSARWAYHHNVGDICGGSNSVTLSPSTNTEANPTQVDCYADAFNWSLLLTAGCEAIGAGDNANKPTLDQAGVTRGSPPDAGAYEYTG